MNTNIIGLMRVCALTVCLSAAAQVSASDPHWDYTEQSGWAYLQDGSSNPAPINYPYAACGIGKSQAPVALTGNPPTRRLNRIKLNYGVGYPIFYNNGHVAQVNSSDSYSGTVSVGNDVYPLIQFHMHSPSEHTVNGRAYEAEIHFVNIRDDGKAVVLTSLVTTGKYNAEFQKVLDNMPITANTKNETGGVTFNPARLLPKNLLQFYTYAGSLTTPPCREGINFYVFAQPITISADQLTALKNIYNNNNREVQPLNGRVVTTTMR
ncbi:MAG: carbonic anhydrase [Methylococcaceae bacterium]|jgi:carbonic anhydrase